MVKNIRPGANQSSTPNEFTTIGGTTYFVATNGKTGRELWKTNGTSASTSLVKDINPGSGGAGVASLHAFGTNLVFRANDGANGAEPWRSDGTPAGTVMIKDINTSAGFSSNPAGFVSLSGTLYFAATDGAHGLELWRSNGTASGTAMVADINPTADSNPRYLTPFKTNLVFSATTPGHGTELWELADFSPPQTKITSHPKKTVRTTKNSAKVRFRFRSDEPGSKFACKLDSGKWKACKSAKTLKVKAGKRKHTFQVRATDKAGNVDRTPARWAWRVKRI
jgi:ELWxxDGT repeat protein